MALLGIKIPVNIGKKLNKIQIPGNKIPIEEYHITLFCFEDNLSINDISKTLKSAYKIIHKTNPFKIKIKNISHFPKNGNNPVPIIAQIESSKLEKFRAQLVKQFDKDKISYSKIFKDYKPHITLSYNKEEISNIKIDNIEIEINEIILWGGDHGDERLSISFCLETSKKYSELLQQTFLFYKKAKNIASSDYNGKFNDLLQYSIKKLSQENEKPQYYDELFKKIRSAPLSSLIRHLQIFINNNLCMQYLLNNNREINIITNIILGAIEESIIENKENFIQIINFIKSNPLKIILPQIKKELINNWHESSYSNTIWLKGIVLLENILFDKNDLEDIFKNILEKYKNDDNLSTDLLQQLNILNNSQLINKKVLDRIKRHIDPTRISYQHINNDKDNFFKKNKYNIDDIIFIFHNHISFENLNNVIKKATPPAQEILRRIIWSTWKIFDNNPLTFILDETFKPIDINGNPLKISNNTVIDAVQNMNSNTEIGKKWLDTFNDYQIIPFKGTFKSF